jgi:hypothetical protein
MSFGGNSCSNFLSVKNRKSVIDLTRLWIQEKIFSHDRLNASQLKQNKNKSVHCNKAVYNAFGATQTRPKCVDLEKKQTFLLIEKTSS